MSRHVHSTDGTNATDRTDRAADAPDATDTADLTHDPASHRPMATEEIAASYDDLADTFARWNWLAESVTGRYRRRQFGDAEGRVLDVACGTGTNFPHLPETVELHGVDVSPAMLEKARDELDRLKRDGVLREMDAQDLEYPDDHFDTVVSALSTCTFPDPVAALREMDRVCRPDGRILLLEHGRSDVGPIARFQDWRAEAHYAKAGCRWDQEPVALVERAGVTVEETRTALAGIVTAIEARPRGDVTDA